MSQEEARTALHNLRQIIEACGRIPLGSGWNFDPDLISETLAHVTELESLLATREQDRRDAERLDWLEAWSKRHGSLQVHHTNTREHVAVIGDAAIWCPSLREAVDAALGLKIALIPREPPGAGETTNG